MLEITVFTLNGQSATAFSPCSVAAAALSNGLTKFRTSVSAEARGPLCGMGTCFECQLTINDVPRQRSCMISIAPGMVVRSDP